MDYYNTADSSHQDGRPSFDGTVKLIISLAAKEGSPISNEMIAGKIHVTMDDFDRYLANNAPKDVFSLLRKEFNWLLKDIVVSRATDTKIPPPDPMYGDLSFQRSLLSSKQFNAGSIPDEKFKVDP